MRQSARQLEQPTGLGALLREGVVLSGGAIMRNPLAVGGTTAFLVAFGFVSANALWYQPHFHEGAFFSTRAPAAASVEVGQPEPSAILREVAPTPQLLDRAPEPPVADTQITQSIEPQPAEPQPAMPGDPTVAKIQTILKGLDLYAGDVDGLTGPQTGAAITAYQRIVGLEQTGEVNDALLTQLGIAEKGANTVDAEQVAAAPQMPETLPVPAPRPRAGVELASATASAPDPRIVRIQAGLRAFGNDGIELDGEVGDRTKRAIEEFQSLFGLPVTGEPDERVFAKMREIGLTD